MNRPTTPAKRAPVSAPPTSPDDAPESAEADPHELRPHEADPHELRPHEADPHELAHDELGSQPVELGTYEIDEGTRLLSAQRVGRAVHVTDRPLGRPGETYLVETAVTSLSELSALAADYRAQASALGDCPMRASAIDAGESSREREAIS